jgi:lipopolysaccharide/colanic/teichoic acid biosynthesis glycosyltransferase
MLSPFLLFVGATIKFGSRGPVFFRQWRVGAGERRFNIWKFRTLRTDHDDSRHQQYVASLRESGGPCAKPDQSKRLVWLGGFYRRHAIDELPQLINVLRGEMSLVGPRPDVLEASCYTQTQRRRFEVAPGITGLWQVSGKNRLTFEQMVEKDIYYVNHRSPWLDGWILLKTIPVLLGAGEN